MRLARCGYRRLLTLSLLLTPAILLAQGGRGDVLYVATPQVAVEELLRMAKVGPDDYVIDLGSGDGRVVIAAAKTFGARGFGVDLDPYLVDLSNGNAEKAGVAERAHFLVQNAFDTDLAPATVVYSYLLPELNLLLRPRLLELKPGTRVVTHDYNMGEWQPEQAKAMDVPENEKQVGDRGRSYLFLWIVPAHLAGRWESTVLEEGRSVPYTFEFTQKFQMVEGALRSGQQQSVLPQFKLTGETFSVDVATTVGRAPITHRFVGAVHGDAIEGTVTIGEGTLQRVLPWSAKQTARADLLRADDDAPVTAPAKGR